MVVGIVGLGLMGGSLGLALQNTKIVTKVVGFDQNQSHCDEAHKLGLVHEIITFEDMKKCDVIFLAIPVGGIIKALQSLSDVPSKTTIIDLGSTKAQIVDSVPASIRDNFIAAHPMTGTEKFGPSAAFSQLYHDKVVVLCDTGTSSDLHKNRTIQIFSHIGMKIVFMDPIAHDEHAAFISHLPHALSYALANSVMAQEDP